MKPILAGTLCAIIFAVVPAAAQQTPGQRPVTPDASPEARALLTYISSLSGRHVLSGQHNYPASGDRNTRYAADYVGETPVVWSQDFGFAADGDKDSYLARPAIIQEAIRQHRQGAIVTLCWHAVPPTADEPITFQPLPGADPTMLASVQGRLREQQFRDLLTPGTEVHARWLAQVDEVASFLRQLQEARVPVLWRPYHEMNGDWFWWGGRYEGEYTTAALYRQIFERMARHHGLDNLIWVWSVDRPSRPDREFRLYYPGNEYLDILSLDVYGNDFDQSYYDGLLALSEGKPLALGEVGNPPALEILDAQPGWTWWVVWAGMAHWTPRAEWERQAGDPRVLFMEDPAYSDGMRAYREAIDLAPLAIDRSADFTGTWWLNAYESHIPSPWAIDGPYRLDVVHVGDALHLRSTSTVEWDDDEVSEQHLTIDGRDRASSGPGGGQRLQNVRLSAAQDTLTIETRVSFAAGERTVETLSRDIWTLRSRGRQLVIVRTTTSPGGSNEAVLVYDRR